MKMHLECCLWSRAVGWCGSSWATSPAASSAFAGCTLVDLAEDLKHYILTSFSICIDLGMRNVKRSDETQSQQFRLHTSTVFGKCWLFNKLGEEIGAGCDSCCFILWDNQFNNVSLGVLKHTNSCQPFITTKNIVYSNAMLCHVHCLQNLDVAVE